jgi:hypothetical protein
VIDWKPFYAALRDWAALGDELNSYWIHEERPITTKPLVTLQILSSVESQPDVLNLVDEAPGNDTKLLTPVITIERDVTVQVKVSSRSQDPEEFALHYAETLRSSLSDPEVVDRLSRAGIEVISHEKIFNLGEVSDQRAESRAVLDVMFRAVFADQAERRGVGFFNRLLLTTEIDRASESRLPDTLQLDDEEIGPP